MSEHDQSRVSYFPDEVIKELALPGRFTFPFYYEPHPLTKLAAAELQHYLETYTGLNHNFGFTADTAEGAIGKMFGVLVIEDTEGKIGHLWGFSGKLADSNDHPQFVPPVFDMLTEDSFFLKEQEVISAINTQIEELTANEDYQRLTEEVAQLSAQSAQEISALKKQLKINKDARKATRDANKRLLDEDAYALLEADLAKQSFIDRHQLRALLDEWKDRLGDKQVRLAAYDARMEELKNERKERSGILQGQLFEQYSFLNKDGKRKNLQDIFSTTAFGRPPAGAGECATPKLLQYAFEHGYRPLAMAEFWWGAAPKSEVRKHKQFYPACAGKCKPILAHMLEGMEIDENPFLIPSENNGPISIVYQDEYLLVVNKPAGLRSVPGVDIYDSVYSRLETALNRELFMVHRLDMGTSGLMIVAKASGVYKHLQSQFLNRTVKKRYTALLSKVIEQNEGEITLPLCADPFNRPMQLVSFESGKTAITRWQVAARYEATTKVHFWPLTGRTHQLRMHSAHELGLNAPIVGDDLYGTADKRLYLHAAQLTFVHPKTKEQMSFEVVEDF
ncbi:MAG: pseudouridine synthase [Bacteroidota bacterium]